MKSILNHLFEHKTLSKENAKEILKNIAAAKYNNSQIAAFLSVYLMRSITVEELAGFREAMLELCLRIDFGGVDTIDIVGTGGDGKNTFNISTLSCFVTAGAGVKVTKHGNYGVSSVSGSSNVLEQLGYKFTNDKSILQKQLDKAGICFLHAPLFHPAMKNVAPVRKELGLKTFFNILGPIVNPCFPKYQLIGTYNLELARLYNYMLNETDKEYLILHSIDGFDEISLTGPFKVFSKTTEQLVEPESIQLPTVKEKDLSGGNSVSDAAFVFLKILKGEGSPSQKAVVIANAAYAIHCAQKSPVSDCVALAKESLESGKAYKVFTDLMTNFN